MDRAAAIYEMAAMAARSKNQLTSKHPSLCQGGLVRCESDQKQGNVVLDLHPVSYPKDSVSETMSTGSEVASCDEFDDKFECTPGENPGRSIVESVGSKLGFMDEISMLHFWLDSSTSAHVCRSLLEAFV